MRWVYVALALFAAWSTYDSSMEIYDLRKENEDLKKRLKI